MNGEGDIADMKSTMRELLEREGLQELGDLVRIKEAWPAVAGEETASKTKPYRLEKGKLVVGVGSHAWVQEMHYRAEDIRSRIKEVTGVEIREIGFKKINLR